MDEFYSAIVEKKTDDTIFPSMFNRCGSYLCLDIDLN